jgi:uroporphyrinogen-III synthase
MNTIPKLRLFISKSMEDLELLPAFCEQNNIELTAHSFLSFEATPFGINSSFDIVFFASPRAVHFFTQTVDCSSKIIAVAGESTRKAAELLNLTVHFSPQKSGNVDESSREFASWVGDKKVLFPTSDISQKSYSNHLTNTQVEFIQIYKTQISTEKVEKRNIYVFTSPSNVKGFLKSNTLPLDATIIAWGETTLNTLQIFVDSKQLKKLQQSSEEELIKVLSKR